MVYAKFGGQTECIVGNSKIENLSKPKSLLRIARHFHFTELHRSRRTFVFNLLCNLLY